MATTQFAFTNLFGVVPTMDAAVTTTENKTPSGTSAATTNASTSSQPLCRVATDTQVYVSFGSAPDASSDAVRFFLPAGAVEYFRVNPGSKGAVVTG